MKNLWLITLSAEYLNPEKVNSIFRNWNQSSSTLYLVDEGVHMQDFIISRKGTVKGKLFICNYSCQIRNISINPAFMPCGLFMLGQLIDNSKHIVVDDETDLY